MAPQVGGCVVVVGDAAGGIGRVDGGGQGLEQPAAAALALTQRGLRTAGGGKLGGGSGRGGACARGGRASSTPRKRRSRSRSVACDLRLSENWTTLPVAGACPILVSAR